MLKVTHLSKIYKKGKNKTVVIDDVSFTLPNKGLVFIVGKSGSGKTTLLNLLAGLDNASSGSIIANGEDITKYKKSEFDKYRNSYIGFIFQEFYLIEQLTLKENVKLALDIANVNDEEAVLRAIEKVGLSGLEDRYMNELSGGQRQRVAIARAIVKNPHIIYADEPTGNLDSKNAKQILDLLKEISNDHLVVIVSHNIESANEYGDRIIELADGKIIKDEERLENYNNVLNISRGVITLPYCKELDNKDISLINENLKQGKIKKLKQLSNGFKTSQNADIEEEKIELKNANMSTKSSLLLSLKFFNKRKTAGLLTVLLNVMLIFILGLCQFFILYETSDAINQIMVELPEEDFILRKARLNEASASSWPDASKPVRSSKEDYVAFVNSGYKGNVYPLYNFSLTLNSTQMEKETNISAESNLKGFYLNETYGTLVTDISYLTRLYGVDGELKVLKGNLYDKPYGVIITDYVADSMLHYFEKYETYDDLLGSYSPFNTKRGYINAIIYTGYKEKLGDYIDKHLKEYEEIKKGQRIWMSDPDKTQEFYTYVSTYIGLNYSLNPDFGNAMLSKENKEVVSINYFTIGFEDGRSTYISNQNAFPGSSIENELDGNKAIIGLNLYNKLFSKTLKRTDDLNIEPFLLKIDKYEQLNSLKNDNPLLSFELEVVGITVDNNHLSDLIISDQYFEMIRKEQVFVYQYYFDDVSSIGSLYDYANDNLFVAYSTHYNTAGTIARIVAIFDEFIALITIVLCIIGVVILMNFGLGNIRKHKYEIGIMLALGSNNKTIIKIFLTQILFIGFLICIFSSLTLFFLTGSVNSLIVNAMSDYMGSQAILSLVILDFDFYVILLDLVIVMIITIISALIPTLYLRNIKPINIIKFSE